MRSSDACMRQKPKPSWFIRRQAIIWTNAWILLIGPLETNFREILIITHAFSFKKMHVKMSSGKWRPFCLGLNLLKCYWSPAHKGCGLVITIPADVLSLDGARPSAGMVLNIKSGFFFQISLTNNNFEYVYVDQKKLFKIVCDISSTANHCGRFRWLDKTT